MLLLVLILVLVAFGLLVVALLTNSVLWAWVSVAVSVTAGVVLLVDWLQRRSALRAGETSSSDGATAAAMPRAEAEPATEALPVIAEARGGTSVIPPDADQGRSDSVDDTLHTVLMPVVQPPGSAGRPSGATPAGAPSSEFLSLSVTKVRPARLDRMTSRPAPPDDVDATAIVPPSLVKDASASARSSGPSSRRAGVSGRVPSDRVPSGGGAEDPTVVVHPTDSPEESPGAHLGVASSIPERSGGSGEPDAPARVVPVQDREPTVVVAANPPTRGPADRISPDQPGSASSLSGTAGSEGPPSTGDATQGASSARSSVGPESFVDDARRDRPSRSPDTSSHDTPSHDPPSNDPWYGGPGLATTSDPLVAGPSLGGPSGSDDRLATAPAAATGVTGPPLVDQNPDPTDLDPSTPARADYTATGDLGRAANGAQASALDPDHANRSGGVQPGVAQSDGAQPAVSRPDVGAHAGDPADAEQHGPDQHGDDQHGDDQHGDDRFGDDRFGDGENAADQHGDDGQAADRFVADEPPEEPRSDAALLVAALEDEVVVIDEQPRYHVTGCRALATVAVIPLPAQEAVELGFTPCGWCSPDRTLAGRHPAAAR